MTLPDQYQYVVTQTGSLMLKKAVEYYGLREAPGSADNPIIMGWAHHFGITWYTHDSIAWCSLFAGEVAYECGFTPPDKNNLLAAVSWATWGIPIHSPFLGVIMVFNRPGGHHVGWYVGEDKDAYHIYGGNTADAVGIARIAKDRLMAMRWAANEPLPANQSRIYVDATGKLSQNEA